MQSIKQVDRLDLATAALLFHTTSIPNSQNNAGVFTLKQRRAKAAERCEHQSRPEMNYCVII